jgi:uncharacterized protein Yka (UPF0111/DUF47 family)
MIQEISHLVAEVMPMLHNLSRNAAKINHLCERISKIEDKADVVLRLALTQLVAQRPDTITFFGKKEVYELLEEVTDSCDDVAGIIQGLLLDHV